MRLIRPRGEEVLRFLVGGNIAVNQSRDIIFFVLFLFEEGVIRRFVVFHLNIVISRNRSLFLGGFDLVERDKFYPRRGHRLLVFVFVLFGRSLGSSGHALENSSAFWADNRIFVQIEELRTAVLTLSLSSEFRLRHDAHIPDTGEFGFQEAPVSRLQRRCQCNLAHVSTPHALDDTSLAVIVRAIHCAESERADVLSQSHSPAEPLASHQAGPLRGRIRPPGDKSISHRAFILGLLCRGATPVEGLLEGDDVMRTGTACRALGAQINRIGEGRWVIQGVGVGALLNPLKTLDFGNAGTGTRLMMGVVGGHAITATFDGDASLRSRPMRRILDPLALIGAQVLSQAAGGRCPIVLKGADVPAPISYQTPVASAQIKSAVLLAGLNAPGATTVIETEASRDHTEKMLAHFGAQVESVVEGDGRRITLHGRAELRPSPVVVPADPSSAAFPIVAALICPGSDIVVEGMMMNPLRTGLLTTLLEMGARIEVLDERLEGGERVADLRVRSSHLRGVVVPANRAPSMIDEYPILAVAAAFAQGETSMLGLHELRVKESDRLKAVATGLDAAGIAHEILGDDLIVLGGSVRGGGMVSTHLDHRIAMSFLVMGIGAKRGMAIDDCSMIATSFPSFRRDMSRLGANFA